MIFSKFAIIKNQFIKGKGEDTVGKFEITGNMQPNGEVHFIKQYIG
jgi:hypothetical protein